jgi:hypothetical protein
MFWNSQAVVSILWSANLLHAQSVRELNKELTDLCKSQGIVVVES